MIIRTPLIPQITATDENIEAIVRYLVELDPNVNYELLNYNPLASSKYELIGKEYGINKNYKMFDEKQSNIFMMLHCMAKFKKFNKRIKEKRKWNL